MLLRRLEFSGIGPFAGRHTIDMDELTAHNVFLIEGPTGAGKSSIIDAIVFALYGDVAGKESSDRRMRSSHTPLSEESWVDLVFTIASGTYRVRRSPSQKIAKKRGEGTRDLAQSASLWRLSEAAVDAQDWDAGEPLATQARETSQIIRDIVGMSKAQFVQTVVLPQGQFADFLRLTSKDRSALLEKIFHTASYRDFTEDLKNQAKEADAHIEQAYAAYSSALDVWLNNDGFSDDVRQALEESRSHALSAKIPDSADSDSEFLARAQNACESLHTASAQAQAALSEAQQEEQLAQTAMNEGAHLAQILAKKADLLTRYSKLTEHQPAIESLKHKIEQHNQASIPLLRQNDADHSRQALQEAQKASHEEEATAASTEEKLRQYDLKINETGELLGQTAILLDQEKELYEKQTAHAALLEESRDLDAVIADLHRSLAALPQQIETLEEQKRAAQILAEREQSIAHELESTHSLIEIAKQHAHAKNRVASAEETLQQALKAQKEAKATFDHVTAQWIASIAANLAQQLEEDAECPVCGSTTHPSPAKPAESYTDRAQVDHAQSSVEESHRSLSHAQSDYSSAQTSLDALASRLGDHTLESLEVRGDQLEKEIAQAKKSAEEISALSQRIDLLSKQKNSTQEALAQKKETAAAIASKLSESETTLKELEERISQARGDFPSIQAKYDDLSSQRNALHAQRQLYTQLSKALADYESAAQIAADALKESPFDSLEAAKEAHLSPDILSEYRDEISTYQEALSGVKAQLAEPEIAQISGEEKVDLEKLTAQHAQKKEKLEHAQQAAALSKQYASAAQKTLGAAVTASASWHKAADSAGAVCRLASIAVAGESSLSNIPLSIWVLLKRFEIVVARANEHLGIISGGRYELKRVDESSGNRKAGLDLHVIDREGSDRGDEERDTSSLSGGETFYTSLALALALAEVVQEEQGGIRIDTLLIDEGFGTLSEDVREAVMRTLTSLSANGRVVGIVSHIDELKRMVPNRITVSRTANGSSTLSVTA